MNDYGDSADFGDDSGSPTSVKRYQSTHPALTERTLGLFAYYNPVRACARKVVSHPVFDQGMLVVVLLNAVVIAIANPRDDPTHFHRIVEVVSTIIFGVEMIVKMVRQRGGCGWGGYARDGPEMGPHGLFPGCPLCLS